MPARKTQLNDVTIRSLPVPASGQVQYADGKLPGFGIRITASGIKTFYLAYRVRGRSRRLTLGRYPFTSLADARAKAHEALVSLNKGSDPQGETPRTPTFDAAVDTFVETHCRHRNRPSTAAETERLLRAVFVPLWKHRLITSFTKKDVLQVIDDLMQANTPSAATHAFAVVRKLFNWCIERGLIEVSPCAGIKSPARPASRERVLTDDELARLWNASEADGYPFGRIFQLLALTAQRRGEVVGMKWSELDFDAGIWTLPGTRTKNHQQHKVPLTRDVIQCLKSIPRGATDLVFPARGKPDQPYSGYSKGKRGLDQRADLHDWTLHDLRRTGATGMARLGIPPHVVERLLNHVSGTFGGVAGVYNRFQYLDEVRDALAKWNAHVSGLVDRARLSVV